MNKNLISDIILTGDFNMIFDIIKDRAVTSEYNHPRSLKIVNTYIEKLELCDIWRVQHPNETRYTCHKKNSSCFSRIDFFLVSPTLAVRTHESNIKTSLNSDHSIITLKINLKADTRGRGFWKFNSHLLKDPKHNQLVENACNAAMFQFGAENPALKWEMIKMFMTRDSISHSRIIASQKNKALKQIQTDIDWLTTQLEIFPEGNQETIEQSLEIKKQQLDSILQEKHKSAIFCSKCTFFAEGKRSS